MMFTSFIICNNENVKRKNSLTFSYSYFNVFLKIKNFRNAYTSTGLMPPNRNEMTLEVTASGCIVFYGNINQNYLNSYFKVISLVIKLLKVV